MSFDSARAVADAVLFEGYALYPYRPSSRKNASRWQFGVLAPRLFSERDGGDPWWMETQCLVEPQGEARVEARLRFLRLRRRQVFAPRPVESLEVDGRLLVSWDEAELHEVGLEVSARGGERNFALPGDLDVETVGPARVERSRQALSGAMRGSVEAAQGAGGRSCLRVRVRVENVTPWAEDAARGEVMGASLLSAHLLLRVTGGVFLSLIDPPVWAEQAAAACRNTRVFPVLAGTRGARDLVLASPIILYDHPEVAPESPGDLFDATEIDEILSLRTRTMTDAEKREAQAADPRIAALIARTDGLSSESLSRLHGVMRPLRPDGYATAAEPPAKQTDGHAPGDRVRLRPGARRSDAQDMFLEGRLATVRCVLHDVDGRVCLAVTVDDDPAADERHAHGRYHYFYVDEVERVAPITSS